MKRIKLWALLSLLLAGCYPINKTLQPSSKVLVVDQSGQPVAGATVMLITNAYIGETTRMQVSSGPTGEAYFPGISEWRVETLTIHGAENYFWTWCVEKAGYGTYLTENADRDEFKDDIVVTLEPGLSTECPPQGSWQ
ncbi:carboxypeptidase-like regulatory domain-containing protein [Allohahella sp. A8]|uniref:carboxypeptidase-like regulatory domain-containing protein n=1 Tax=Allohahella sp. A8 TaxID=3141461 RepID=UPI003A80FF8D